MRMLTITLGILSEKSHFSTFAFSLFLFALLTTPDGGANVLNGEHNLNSLSGFRICPFVEFCLPAASSSIFLFSNFRSDI